MQCPNPSRPLVWITGLHRGEEFKLAYSPGYTGLDSFPPQGGGGTNDRYHGSPQCVEFLPQFVALGRSECRFMLDLKSHDLRNVFRLCSIECGPQPILAIADQSITGIEQADPSGQASTPKDG